MKTLDEIFARQKKFQYNFYDVDKLTEEAIKLFPDHYYLIWIKAITLMGKQHFKEAIPLFKRLVSIDRNSMDAGAVAYDEKIGNKY